MREGTAGQLVRALLLSAVGLAVLWILPSSAGAAFTTGLSGPEYRSPSTSERGQWLDRTLDARAGIVRITVSWGETANVRPADPGNPADPAYNFAGLDSVIRDTVARGLEPLLTIQTAPPFAEGSDRPGSAPAGSWRPDPAAFGDFATAIARRYSGGFGGLPRVRYFQAWNEPNLSTYLTPVWKGRGAASAKHYRRLLNAFYAAVKAADRDNLVITAGTAPYGERRGGNRVRPLAFWRAVLCLRERRGDLVRACRAKTRFDVLAHHPINTSGGPRRSAVHPDDVSTPDLASLRRVLRAAERARTTGGPRRHRLWATEIWWETDPPDTQRGVSLGKQARYLAEALYVLWKAGAKVVVNLQIRDQQYDPANPDASTQAGLYFFDGTPKPALSAFRFPFVADRLSKRSVRVWTRVPIDGTLVIEKQKGDGWAEIASRGASPGVVVTRKLHRRGSITLRGRIGGLISLPWTVKQ